MTSNPQGNVRQITDQELANYVVCPESWYLKCTRTRELQVASDHADQSKKVRQEWHDKNNLLREVLNYRKAIYLLLLGVVTFLCALEVSGLRSLLTGGQTSPLIDDLSSNVSDNNNWNAGGSNDSIPFEIAALFGILGICVFVYDRLEHQKKLISKEVGLGGKTIQIPANDRGKEPSRILQSVALGITGKPDALVLEDKKLTPIIFQPFGKKVQDRHVIRLIAYNVMLQELGEDTDYGVLVLGEKQRRVVIRVSEQKKEWLISVINEMRAIIAGEPAIAAPSKFKCRNCDVRGLCKFRATPETAHTNFQENDINREE